MTKQQEYEEDRKWTDKVHKDLIEPVLLKLDLKPVIYDEKTQFYNDVKLKIDYVYENSKNLKLTFQMRNRRANKYQFGTLDAITFRYQKPDGENLEFENIQAQYLVFSLVEPNEFYLQDSIIVDISKIKKYENLLKKEIFTNVKLDKKTLISIKIKDIQELEKKLNTKIIVYYYQPQENCYAKIYRKKRF